MSDRGTLIIGTAGHIDHGKTQLVRALTGQETDRLREEKERGISIELGFAHYEVEGRQFGLVDVPGHERFIKHMLAGAHGIDLVLIAIAADDGIMPQTEEHFDILHLLGVEHGIFVITKCDLASPERVAEVRDDIEILACDTRFEESPVFEVSSTTGAGIDALRSGIAQALDVIQPREPSGYFRLPIDRSFAMHGHGLVVTGTATAGRVKEGDVLTVRPGGAESRARSLQIHGETVRRARAGQRVAVNLASLSKDDVPRGRWLTDPRVERLTQRFDALLELRSGASKPLRSFERVRLHCATTEVMAKVILFGDQRELAPKEKAWCQIALEGDLLLSAGDRFVIRTQTATRTTGGGEVIHPFAMRHKAAETDIPERLERLRDGEPPEQLLEFVQSLHEFAVPVELVAQGLGQTSEDVLRLRRDQPQILALPTNQAPEALTTATKWERVGVLVVEALDEYHRVHPLEPGMELESLRSRLAVPLPPKLFRPVIEKLEAEGKVVREDAIARRPSHKVKLQQSDEDLAAKVLASLAEGGLTPPDVKQLAKALELGTSKVGEILRVLERKKSVTRITHELYYESDAYERCRAMAIAFIEEKGQITVADFRNLISASRKYAVPVLEHFDKIALTVRVEDARRLRRKQG